MRAEVSHFLKATILSSESDFVANAPLRARSPKPTNSFSCTAASDESLKAKSSSRSVFSIGGLCASGTRTNDRKC